MTRYLVGFLCVCALGAAAGCGELYPPWGGGGGHHKVLMCHVPPGNPDNAHEIWVGESAVPAHLDHGDTLGACPFACTEQEIEDAEWASFGRDLDNSRWQKCETQISPESAARLELKWVFDGFTENDVHHPVGDISATPSVVGDGVFFVDWTEGLEEAKVYRIHKETREVVWWRYIWDIADFVEVDAAGNRTPIPGLVSRTSPLVVGDSVIIGTQRRRPELFRDPRPNAWIISLDKNTGAVQWKTEPPRDPLWPTPAQDPSPKDEAGNELLPIPDGSEIVITASPVAHDNRIYVGVSGWAEFLSFWAHYRFFYRGSVLCLDATNGDVIWQSFMVDDDLYVTSEEPETDPNTGQPIPRDRRRYTGNSVWSSAPAIDVKRERLYVTTGNNHTAPKSVLEGVGSGEIVDLPQPGNYMDSIVALDLGTGAAEWSYSPVGNLVDVWQIFCRDTDSDSCAEGPDFDYGAGANLFSVEIGGERRDVVGAGSKAGTYSAVEADTEDPRPAPLWETQVGPGSFFGGIHWGTSVANGVVYAPLGDGFRESGDNGFFAALDGATGQFVWKVPNPIADEGFPPANYPAAFGGIHMSIHAPTTVANGVVFGAPFDLEGHMLALDAATGDLLWSYPSGATVYGGPAVVDGVVYWGNGYQTVAGTRGKGLFAFHVP
ncbi:MAG: PQQ-binding-like beta-propeller repeat protein [Myxococcales bacterium]|nr:PQQ-binding-like beta-propeller repeat protein [Myxococcales bacterium]MDH3842774.1 PQQ-binding-like beta-propeller repeat protein [Myxococcales bacterium]